LSDDITLQDLLEVQEYFGLPRAALVEKDSHVVQALAAIIAIDKTRFRLVFGGGTALSRAHRIIRRMSEDIDLRIVSDREPTRPTAPGLENSLLLALVGLAAIFARIEDLPKGSESGLNIGAVGDAIEVLGQAVRVEVQHVRGDAEDFGELVDNGILRRVAPVMLEIVEVGWQNLPAILSAETLGDLFLSHSRLLASFRNYLAERFHSGSIRPSMPGPATAIVFIRKSTPRIETSPPHAPQSAMPCDQSRTF